MPLLLTARGHETRTRRWEERSGSGRVQWQSQNMGISCPANNYEHSHVESAGEKSFESQRFLPRVARRVVLVTSARTSVNKTQSNMWGYLRQTDVKVFEDTFGCFRVIRGTWGALGGWEWVASSRDHLIDKACAFENTRLSILPVAYQQRGFHFTHKYTSKLTNTHLYTWAASLHKNAHQYS